MAEAMSNEKTSEGHSARAHSGIVSSPLCTHFVSALESVLERTIAVDDFTPLEMQVERSFRGMNSAQAGCFVLFHRFMYSLQYCLGITLPKHSVFFQIRGPFMRAFVKTACGKFDPEDFDVSEAQGSVIIPKETLGVVGVLKKFGLSMNRALLILNTTVMHCRKCKDKPENIAEVGHSFGAFTGWLISSFAGEDFPNDADDVLKVFSELSKQFSPFDNLATSPNSLEDIATRILHVMEDARKFASKAEFDPEHCSP